jgi:phosphoglycolate phosphatase-like HAD superfamily hydrolase
MIKAVIFDVDGTLVDTVDLHAQTWREALERFGRPVPFNKVREQIGKGDDQLLPAFLSDEELTKYSKEIEKYRGDLYRRKYLPQARAFPKVRELFQKAYASERSIALGCSCKGDEVDSYGRLARIDDLPTIDISGDDVDKSKPNPEIFEIALRRLNCTSSEAIVVGDSPYDAIAASKINLPAIGFLAGGFPENWLKTSGSIAIFQDPADLLENYERSPIVTFQKRTEAPRTS